MNCETCGSARSNSLKICLGQVEKSIGFVLRGVNFADLLLFVSIRDGSENMEIYLLRCWIFNGSLYHE